MFDPKEKILVKCLRHAGRGLRPPFLRKTTGLLASRLGFMRFTGAAGFTEKIDMAYYFTVFLLITAIGIGALRGWLK